MTPVANIPLRLLIVEDNEDDALLIVRELKRGGFDPSYERVQSPAGLEAALAGSAPEWDMVITDYNLPGFDPSAVLERLKSEQVDIPIIMVSGSIGEETAVETMKAGAHDYIMKDNLARLVPAVHRELREARNRLEHRAAQATIQHMAYHDPLTNLANRYEFERRLEALLHEKPSTDHQHVLLFLDLDQFKVINDTCGHSAGDDLLRQVAVLLRSRIRDSDTLARLGGDEFGLLLHNCRVGQATQLAEDLLDVLRDFRFVHETKSFVIGGSIGLVALGDGLDSASAVMQAADMACYAAKDRGRNRVQIYTPEDEELTRRHGDMEWTSKIQSALDENRFKPYAQPIVDAAQPSTEGPHFVELLLRLEEPDGSLTPPGAFIPAAERYGLMTQLDRWMVRCALQHISELPTDSTVERFFVNLSGASLGQEDFCPFVRSTMDRLHCDPSRVCFEITETAAIANLANAVSLVDELRGIGCRFALDDFGSGLSSFAYLKTLPVDYLKIDGAFVQDIVTDPFDRGIVEAAVHIGHIAGMKVIAEWVESADILKLLAEAGVDYVQGYHIAMPAPLLPDQ